MPTVPYSPHIRSVPDGRLIYPDYDCQVEFSVRASYGEPVVRISAVYVEEDGKPPHDLLASEDLLALGTGLRVKATAEDDRDFELRALEAAGWEYVSRGSNDPDGMWVYRGEREDAA